MTGRMVPTRQWGSGFEEILDEAEAPQRFGCATCGQISLTVFMVNGTITCKEHINDPR